MQTTGEAQLQGVMAGARSVLCIPISYGESLMGVLNVESLKEDAFFQPEFHEVLTEQIGITFVIGFVKIAADPFVCHIKSCIDPAIHRLP